MVDEYKHTEYAVSTCLAKGIYSLDSSSEWGWVNAHALTDVPVNNRKAGKGEA